MQRLTPAEITQGLADLAAWREEGRPKNDPRSVFDGIDFDYATLNDCTFDGATLTNCWFNGATLTDCWFNGATLTDCWFDGATLTNCWFNVATLTGCTFDGAKITNCTFDYAKFTGCWFNGAKIDDASHQSLIDWLAPPVMDNIDSVIYRSVTTDDGRLNMHHWHTCKTTHCRAGWAIHLAGRAGYVLEKRVGSWLAGHLIYAVSRPGVAPPDFFADHDVAMADIARCAGVEATFLEASKCND